ncbi:hypothetical protein HN011_011700 [Eciton burchellii]|nr:hypothetical protein HN011_011700 [Eciton burchellii]
MRSLPAARTGTSRRSGEPAPPEATQTGHDKRNGLGVSPVSTGFADREALGKSRTENETNERVPLFYRARGQGDPEKRGFRGARRTRRATLDGDVGERLCGIPRADSQPRRGVPDVGRTYLCVGV